MKKFIFFITLFSIFAATFAFGQKTNYGTIEGKLIYPSDYIPPTMIICVQEIGETSQTVCSDSKTKDYKFTLNYENATYSAKLPAGEYYIFAAFPYGKAPVQNMEGAEAYYTEFVKCGLSVDCKSHEKLSFKVEANKTKSDITPGDWYDF